MPETNQIVKAAADAENGTGSREKPALSRLAALRHVMETEQVDLCLVTTADAHGSEYPGHIMKRAPIFPGSPARRGRWQSQRTGQDFGQTAGIFFRRRQSFSERESRSIKWENRACRSCSKSSGKDFPTGERLPMTG